MLTIKDTNWITEAPTNKKIYEVRVRYRGTLHKVMIKVLAGSKAEVSFTDSEDNAAAGQSVVVYDGERCVGGGIIV